MKYCQKLNNLGERDVIVLAVLLYALYGFKIKITSKSVEL